MKIKITTTIIYSQKNLRINQLKNNDKIISIIMLRFGETKVTKEKLYGTKRPINFWEAYVDNIVILKLIETRL